MVSLANHFFLKSLPSLWRWQVSVFHVGVDSFADLFDRQLFERIVLFEIVPLLSQSTAKQEAQLRHLVVAVNATPATNFEMVHPEFVLGRAGFVDQPDGIDMLMIAGDDLLATIP